MARVRKPRKPRVRRNREESTSSSPDREWLNVISSRMTATRVLNDRGERPYWLSFPWDEASVNTPLGGYSPCTHFLFNGRAYYGFMFREHRDMMFDREADRLPRKEFTDTILEIKGKR